ncbi:zinc dependent phospholipase C family protein [Halobacillus litoralis]|uniref:zinc dependent phospholipase C family protein n=1 Tax=Halobacillus litoralis TaxID=45668 RepID=UPI001CD292A7|nr:zinc dependent phospholipase C family protein [Halobacillus litoralis]MCA0969695.1 zinc dependent phospholipase C family protein [Halobacillus litoralis]
MPNTWTHILFIDELCTRTGRQDLLEACRLPLHIGAQGPDPFFYHQFWPFLPEGEGESLGMQLHTENCGWFLMDLIEKGTTKKSKEQAFILGFVSHHCLDRITHPYIHYHAGYEGNKHQVLEVAIDTVMMERKRGLKTWRTPVHKELKPHTLLNNLTDMLSELIERHYPNWSKEKAAPVIQQSYKQMYQAQRILYDPWNWKNKTFPSLVSSFSHQLLEGATDYLNERNHDWNHSATNETFNQSFLDLYDEALREGEDLISDILAYWSSPSSELLKSIEQKVGNRSYDTGRPLTENQTNLYSSPIV